MDKYGSVCAPLLNVIPVVGSALAGFTKQGIEQATKGTPWHKQFDKAAEKLAALGWRVLLVADDIDRLDADELIALLRVVRLLGRFPNVHYLVAYDQNTIENLLEKQGLSGHSSDFMEKIVQYPFEVPPVAPVIQRRLLTETIDKLIATYRIPLTSSQSERFSELIGILAPALKTARAKNRFEEQLLAFGKMLDFREEIDVVDFVAISYLRVFYHNIYDRIPAWKEALQSGREMLGHLENSKLSEADWTIRIRELTPREDDAVLVKHILASLFSGIKSIQLSVKEHKLALYNDAYFHRYFLFGVPEDDIEDRLIKSAIMNIIAGDLMHNDVVRFIEILDSDNNQLAALAYEKSHRFRSESSGAPSTNLVRFLLSRIKALPAGIPSFASAGNVLWRWAPLEVLRSLTSGQLTEVDVFASGMPERDILTLAGRMLANGRIADPAKIKALEGFADIFRKHLMEDIGSVLDSDLNFNSMISLVSKVSVNKDMHDLGDILLSNGDIDVLDRVIRAMVMVNRWGGDDNELIFNSETLALLFRQEAILQLVQLLPATSGLSLIKKNDLSPENQSSFARASLKSVSEMVSS